MITPRTLEANSANWLKLTSGTNARRHPALSRNGPEILSMKSSPIVPVWIFSACGALASDGGYLFVTFRGEQTPMSEQVHFALSKDGREWAALHDGAPALVSTIGEKGARDPYIIRSADGKKFHIIATDLSIHLNHNWSRAVRAGSRSLLVWDSEDLVTWSEPRLVKVAPDDAGCTWAPETVYDTETGQYLVYWASTTKTDDFAKHRIWAAWTKDFRSFTDPFIYIEKPESVIDTSIVRGDGDAYFRFTKDERIKGITMETSKTISGDWTEVAGFNLGHLRGYEGPQCYRTTSGDGSTTSWCLILDKYGTGEGYQPFVTDDLSSGVFKEAEGFTFPFLFRHGSILPVTPEEFDRLEAAHSARR